MPEAPKIFLSYSRHDDEFARKLASDLSLLGLQVWLDQARLVPSDDFRRAIQHALTDSNYVLVLLSSRSIELSWLRDEAKAPLVGPSSGRVFPVALDEVAHSQLSRCLNTTRSRFKRDFLLDLSDSKTYECELRDFVNMVLGRTLVRETAGPVGDFLPQQEINYDLLATKIAEEMQLRMAEREGDHGQGINKNLLFVICSFDSDMDPIFEGIEAAARDYGLNAKRMKDVVGDYRITDKIVEYIRNCRLLVADLTYERPNVYFELGYARGLNKRVITTARSGTKLHFDVQDWTCTFYSDSRVLERSLKERFNVELSALRNVRS